MKISIIVEGKTEKVFIRYLRRFLEPRLQGKIPTLDLSPYDGRIPTEQKLRRLVFNLLKSADVVIALTDVYTGTSPPDFLDATDAKAKMRSWVGNEPRFRPHAAQYDFEAWLLPYWGYIQKLARHNKVAPNGNPEMVNHHNPPSQRLAEIFRIGERPGHYVKPRDAGRILEKNDLSVAVAACSELKAFVDTILTTCGADPALQ